MDDDLKLYLSILDAAGGSMLYSDLYAAWPAEKRSSLGRVKEYARRHAIAVPMVSWDAENNRTVHRIVKVS